MRTLRRCSPGLDGPCWAAAVTPTVARSLLEELDHGRFDPRADIDGSARVAVLEGQEVGQGDVADVHVVAGLEAVAVDDDRLSAEQPVSEDGHDAGFAQRALARTVHVRVAQSDPSDPVQAGPAARGRARRPAWRRRTATPDERADPPVSEARPCRRRRPPRWTSRSPASRRSAGCIRGDSPIP